MKLLLLFLSAVGISSIANAQKRPGALQKFKNNWKVERPLVVIVPKDSSLLSLYPDVIKKPGIYRLKDGMPCIVPDTKDLAVIPNAWNGSIKTPYKGKKPMIPNPSTPDLQNGTK